LLLHLGGRQFIADLPRSESFQMVGSAEENWIQTTQHKELSNYESVVLCHCKHNRSKM
jgi:hypothetical protein